MAKRIITAAIWIPIAVVLLAFAPIWGIVLAIAVLSAIGAYELLWRTGFAKKSPMCCGCGVVFAAVVPVLVCFNGSVQGLAAMLFVFAVLCFLDGMRHQETITFEMISGTFFAAFLIPLFISSFFRVEMQFDMRLMFALPLVYAFCSDAGGYFVGRVLGKHKLAPKLSPKKTVEGSVGGMVFAVLGGVIFGLIAQFAFGLHPNYLVLALFGIPMSIISQFGDLTFSFIKREFGIKDYGTLFVGHGGVLDRFDSVIFAAPMLELLLCVAPIF